MAAPPAFQLIELLHADCPAPPAGRSRCGHTIAAPLLGLSPDEFLDHAALWASVFLRRRHGRALAAGVPASAPLHRANVSAEVAWAPHGGLDVAPTDIALLGPSQWAGLRALLLADPGTRSRCVVRVRFLDGGVVVRGGAGAGAYPRRLVTSARGVGAAVRERREAQRAARGRQVGFDPGAVRPRRPGAVPRAVGARLVGPCLRAGVRRVGPLPRAGSEDAPSVTETLSGVDGPGPRHGAGMAPAAPECRDLGLVVDPVLFEGPEADEWRGLSRGQDEQDMWEACRPPSLPPPWPEHEDLLHGGLDLESYYELAGADTV